MVIYRFLNNDRYHNGYYVWQSNPHDNAADWINFELDRYLSLSHLEHPEQGCVLPTLATEVARADDTIKQTYEQELLRGHALFSTHLASEEKAWVLMSQLVGAVLIARAIHNPELQKTILQANKMIIQDYLAAHSAA